VITLKFTFTVQFDAGTPETPPPIAPREEPRPRQTFFDWYEPEERPPVVEATPEACRETVLSDLRQLCFPWYED